MIISVDDVNAILARPWYRRWWLRIRYVWKMTWWYRLRLNFVRRKQQSINSQEMINNPSTAVVSAMISRNIALGMDRMSVSYTDRGRKLTDENRAEIEKRYPDTYIRKMPAYNNMHSMGSVVVYNEPMVWLNKPEFQPLNIPSRIPWYKKILN